MITLAVRGEFGQSAYEANELYAKHHLDTSSIISAMEHLQKKTSFMNLDTEVLKTKWKDVSHEVRNKWDSISEKELERVKGNMFAMVSLIQEKFGIPREDAIKKVEELLSKYSKDELKMMVGETALKAFSTATTIIDQVKSKIKK